VFSGERQHYIDITSLRCYVGTMTDTHPRREYNRLAQRRHRLGLSGKIDLIQAATTSIPEIQEELEDIKQVVYELRAHLVANGVDKKSPRQNGVDHA